MSPAEKVGEKNLSLLEGLPDKLLKLEMVLNEMMAFKSQQFLQQYSSHVGSENTHLARVPVPEKMPVIGFDFFIQPPNKFPDFVTLHALETGAKGCFLKVWQLLREGIAPLPVRELFSPGIVCFNEDESRVEFQTSDWISSFCSFECEQNLQKFVIAGFSYGDISVWQVSKAKDPKRRYQLPDYSTVSGGISHNNSVVSVKPQISSLKTKEVILASIDSKANIKVWLLVSQSGSTDLRQIQEISSTERRTEIAGFFDIPDEISFLILFEDGQWEFQSKIQEKKRFPMNRAMDNDKLQRVTSCDLNPITLSHLIVSFQNGRISLYNAKCSYLKKQLSESLNDEGRVLVCEKLCWSKLRVDEFYALMFGGRLVQIRWTKPSNSISWMTVTEIASSSVQAFCISGLIHDSKDRPLMLLFKQAKDMDLSLLKPSKTRSTDKEQKFSLDCVYDPFNL